MSLRLNLLERFRLRLTHADRAAATKKTTAERKVTKPKAKAKHAAVAQAAPQSEELPPDARVVEIARLAAAAGETDAIEDLLALPTLDDARAEIERRSGIRSAVTMAQNICPTIGTELAAEFIRNKATAKEAGKGLIEIMAASQSPEILNTHQPGNLPAGVGNEHGWDDIVAKHNAELRK